jgi:hypothetical protein
MTLIIELRLELPLQSDFFAVACLLAGTQSHQ